MTEGAAVLPCAICGTGTGTELDGLHDDRYGFPARFSLARCDACGHRQLRAEFTPDQLETLYSSYYPRRSMSVDEWKPYEALGAWAAWFHGERGYAYRWVPKNVRVLDIGCGFGQTLGYHRARGCEARGVEADSNAARVAEKYGLDIRIGLFDPSAYAEGSFDYVTMDQVIEHVTDPVTTLTGVAKVLAPGGTAILSTPNADGWGARLFGIRWINWHAPYHLQFFSLRSMAIATRKAGLVVESARTITSSEWLFYQWIHLLSYPQVAEPSDFWSPRPGRPVMQRKSARLALLLHRLRFNHLLTRLFDGIGLGDNRLFFLRKA